MNDVSAARPSATVALAREGAIEPEIFMVLRHEHSSFGKAFAFPGGTVIPEDAAVHDYCLGLDDIDASARLGVDHGGLDYYSAAVRELFEETGVLLADIATLDENLESVRAALNDGSLNWAEFVARNKLQLRCDGLFYFSHWITPPSMPARYSTRFFLTVLPSGQEPVHCGVELTDSCWASASEMLAAGRRGDAKLHFPTIKTLESLARHKTLGDLSDWAETKVNWGVTSMLPMLIERNGKLDIVLPGDKDYPGAKS